MSKRRACPQARSSRSIQPGGSPKSRWRAERMHAGWRFMNPQRDPTTFVRLARVLAAGAAAWLGACSTPPPAPAPPPPKPRAFWDGDGIPGSPRIVIDLSAQRARYYKGGRLVGETPVATGRASHPTPTGTFKVTEKNLNHRSSWYGDYVYPDGTVARADIDVRKDARPPGSRYLGASMKYFMRINGPVGMHEGFLPGYPASHGCIRLPTQMAAIFFRETPLGTPVQVTGHASNAPREAPIYIGQDVLGREQPFALAETTPVHTQPAEPKLEVRKARPVREHQSNRQNSPPPLRRGQTQYLYY